MSYFEPSKIICRGRSTCMKFDEDCCKNLKLKYASNTHSHGFVT